ncbi:MAG TPA: hypothetical protein VEN79_09230 [Terriglobia bacterium]|nr:hypothetical protein [Terriglobia bacterium]
MADSKDKLETAGESFHPRSREPESARNWLPMIVGGVVVLIAVTLVVVFVRNKPLSNQVDPYAAKLQISNLHMETAENFAGGSVTYIEGTLTNTGDRKVSGATMQAIFKNSLGELVGDPVLPVMTLQPNTPIVDYGPMDRAPLGAGQKRDFRITLEHISADWDGQIPQLKVVAVVTS